MGARTAGCRGGQLGSIARRLLAARECAKVSKNAVHKLLLMSALLALIIIPGYCAQDSNPRRGLKRTIFGVIVFNAIYLAVVITIYERICW